MPLGYLITFHTYGSWLPGDPRGFVNQRHNQHGAPYSVSASGLEEHCYQRLQHPPVILSDAERALVGRTIEEVLRHRRWELVVADVRTNHVHVVIKAESPPEPIMNALKAWSTRRLVEAGHRSRGCRIWVRHGSTRYLFDAKAVEGARRYVSENQGHGTFVRSSDEW